MSSTTRPNFRNIPYSEMTGAEQDRYNLEMYFWDEYRSVHGTRPRWVRFETISDEKLDRMCRQLSDEIEAELRQRDDRRAKLAAARKNPRATIWLSHYGELCRDFDGKVDPEDPECWNWTILPEAPKVSPLADAFAQAGL